VAEKALTAVIQDAYSDGCQPGIPTQSSVSAIFGARHGERRRLCRNDIKR
jgi:hypothetical protein